MAGKPRHGKSRSPEYRAWVDMKTRCLKTTCASYSRYGGRGIRVCDRWLDSFENFYEDMGDRPADTFSLERINNEGDYSPDNCEWIPMSEQARNTRQNHIIDGKLITDIAAETGVSITCIRRRKKLGHPISMPKHTMHRGGFSVHAKLTNEQAAEIRRIWSERLGEKGLGRKLAKEFSVSAGIICRVVKFQNYKNA